MSGLDKEREESDFITVIIIIIIKSACRKLTLAVQVEQTTSVQGELRVRASTTIVYERCDDNVMLWRS